MLETTGEVLVSLASTTGVLQLEVVALMASLATVAAALASVAELVAAHISLSIVPVVARSWPFTCGLEISIVVEDEGVTVVTLVTSAPGKLLLDGACKWRILLQDDESNLKQQLYCGTVEYSC